MKSITALLILATILAADTYHRGLKPAMVSLMKSEQRLALVIGNDDYKGRFDRLDNPVSDAKLIRDTLDGVGFEVIYGENVTMSKFNELFKKYQKKLAAKGGVGLFYYAGHGIEVDGKNYLIASDSLIREPDDVEFQSVRLNYVVEKIQNAQNRFNIIVLDACRNNPFLKTRGLKSGGLARLQNARGIFVAYATEEGKVAYDGNAQHSIFSETLSENIKNPLPIEEVFKNTRERVWKETNYEQFPGVYNQAIGQFYFTLPTPEPERLAMRTDANGSAIALAPYVPVEEEDDSTTYWIAGGGALLIGGGAAALAGGGGGGDDGGSQAVAVASDTTIELTWSGANDLDLIVEDPCGQRIGSYNTSVECQGFSGELTQQANTMQIDSDPKEIVVFNEGGAEGNYYVYVSDSLNREGAATDFIVKVSKDGAEDTATGSVEAGKIQPVTSFSR